MSGKKNKAFVQRYHDEFWRRANVAAVDDFCAPDFKFHLGSIVETSDRSAYKQFISVFFAGFPDFSCTASEPMSAEGDRVITRYAWSGTHTAASPGVFNRLPPTGKKVAVTGIIIDRLANGKIAEEWCEEDTMGLALKLGVVSPME